MKGLHIFTSFFLNRPFVSLIVVANLLFIPGCAAPKRVILVSPEQFKAAYRLPSHLGLQTKFRRDSSYAEIDFYRWGALSILEYTGTWRTPIESLTPGLLDETRVVFEGANLSEKQKEMLDIATRKAEEAGLFAPDIFPEAPSWARMKE